MSSDAFVQTIKQIAVSAVGSEKFSNLVIGRVASVSPLSVELDGVGVVPSSLLRRIQPVGAHGSVDTSFTTNVNTNGSTNISGTAVGEIEVEVKDDTNKVLGKAKGNISLPVTGSGAVSTNGAVTAGSVKEFDTAQHALQVGDEVALLRYQGGSFFLVLGKVGDV